MPKATEGGASNAWETAGIVTCANCGARYAEGAPRCPECPSSETTEAELPPPPPVSAPKADHVEYAAAVLEVPADEAAAMTKADLVELARPDDSEAEAVPRPPRRTTD